MRLNDKQLDERIQRFMNRKMREFPELRQMGGSHRDPNTRPSVADTPFSRHHRIPSWHLSQVTQ